MKSFRAKAGTPLRQTKKALEEQLALAGFPDAEEEAQLLLFDAAGIDRHSYLMNRDRPLTEEAAERLNGYTKRRMPGEPVQYIIGKAWFYGREFEVNPSVLIPRYDTEVLVEEVLKVIKGGESVLDLCTGSGCIIITLVREADIKGIGSDISAAALETAKRNSRKLNAECSFICSDLLDDIPGKSDIIVSNPPYIRTEEVEELDTQVKDYEPGLALDGGADGCDLYRRIMKDAPAHLNRGGKLFLEIGCDQAQQVTGLMAAAGFSHIRVIADLSGLDRVVSGVWE